jgi:hypothetical protein
MTGLCETPLSLPEKFPSHVGQCNCGADCGPQHFIMPGFFVCDTCLPALLASCGDDDEVQR